MFEGFTLGGNWVDLVIIALLLFSLWEGMERGLILGTIDLFGFFSSFLASLKLYPYVGQILSINFNLPRGIANALGFLLAGFLAQVIYSVAVNYFYRRIPRSMIKTRWNRWSGFIPSIGSGAVFIAFVLTVFISLPIRGSVKADILSSKIGSRLVHETQGVEHELRGVFGEAVNETLNFITIPPSSQEHIDLKFTQKELTVSPQDEQAMLSLINAERQKEGLESLKSDEKLKGLAQAHAKDMFERGYFSHYSPEGLSPFDRMEKAKIQFQAAGENLALAPSVNLAHQGLMNSPGHRKNILSPDFGKVGIGAIDGGVYGVMFVQEFTD